MVYLFYSDDSWEMSSMPSIKSFAKGRGKIANSNYDQSRGTTQHWFVTELRRKVEKEVS